MAFVSTCGPAGLRSSFMASEPATESRLGLGGSRRTSPVVTMGMQTGMSGIMRDFLKTSSRGYKGNSTTATTAPTPSASRSAAAATMSALFNGSGVGSAIPSQERDAMKDTVKPRTATKADTYMADNCVTAQYKAIANPTGVYSSSCTEGVSKHQAEESRELSNMARFRQMQRPLNRKYFDYFETRKMATNMAHGCSYEEKMVANFPKVAAAMVRGYSEAKSLCVRYSNANSPEESYMAKCVDMQYKRMAVPNGVYGVTCTDGNQPGLADFKRVQAISARFRANQMSDGAKEQAKYDAKMFARSMFRTCNYEEEVYNAMPAVASSMRPLTARY